MRNTLLKLTAFTTLYLGNGILQYFGYQHSTSEGSILFRLHPTSYILLFLIIINLLFNKSTVSNLLTKRIELIFILILFSLLIFLILSERANAVSFIIDTILDPVLLSLLVKNKNEKFKSSALLFANSFLIINSITAILEKVLEYNIFPIKYTYGLYFRSTAFQGHPLNNALITSIVIAFVFTSDLKWSTKYALSFIGVCSLICFSARGSIYVLIPFLLIYSFVTQYNDSRKRNPKAKSLNSFSKGLIVIFTLCTLYVIVFQSKIGERLVAVSYYDDSADVRMQSLKMLNIFKSDQLLWGESQEKIDNIMIKANIDIIENFWILWILKFGLFFTLILAFILTIFFMKILNPMRLQKKILLISVFFAVASTNNSLATNTTAIVVFAICSYAYKPVEYLRVSKSMYAYTDEKLQ